LWPSTDINTSTRKQKRKRQVIRVLVQGNKRDQGSGPKQQEWSGYWPDSVKTTGVEALVKPPPIEEPTVLLKPSAEFERIQKIIQEGNR
jgi:hypothetical protein